MSSFTEATFKLVPGVLERGRPVYEATAAFRFWIGAPDAGCCITVPAGFRTDFASVWHWAIRLGRFLAPSATDAALGSLAKSAALHDRMRRDLQFNLIDSDALFLVAMKADGVNPALREIAFLIVRNNCRRD